MTPFLRLWKLRDAFRSVFKGGGWRTEAGTLKDDAQLVLADLRDFCGHGNVSVVVGRDGHIDSQATLYAEGKRAVLLRIQRHMAISDEELFALKGIDDHDRSDDDSIG